MCSGRHCSIDLVVRGRVRLNFSFNSLNCISGLVLLCSIVVMIFVRRHDFCYDHMTSQPLFVHSFMQFELNCMCDVIFPS